MAKVAVIMGSRSDWEIMREAKEILEELGVPCHAEVVSAHRTPEKMFQFARNARSEGFSVIIAGAGGAAHLPGMVASLTTLPVIGVPIRASHSLDGWDSILSILQMPAGIPVATVALNGARNAGLLAAQILAIGDRQLQQKLEDYRAMLAQQVHKAQLDSH
ncbi:MAG: 5-(carboxyamino)imidazole ribonucleotide mutase [Turneriella sp.]|nr:5-(carboxyamino)imidazole ribonucleotide mutase [Leptospiraceae bacterium]MCX7633957.1 5-(carboxyamino)imidazole ribonucleotide mutase [Turneriella sp.]